VHAYPETAICQIDPYMLVDVTGANVTLHEQRVVSNPPNVMTPPFASTPSENVPSLSNAIKTIILYCNRYLFSQTVNCGRVSCASMFVVNGGASRPLLFALPNPSMPDTSSSVSKLPTIVP
jgi:hypothetical protein